ncbi:Splicing factor, partial [Entophlyctis luteolus]
VHLFHDIQKARAIYDTLLLAHPQSASLVIAASMFERNHGRDVSKASWILNRAAPKQIGGNAAAVTNAYVLHGAIVSLAKDTGCLSDAEYYAALEKADAAARRSAAIAAAAQASAEKRSAAVVWDDADGGGGVSKKARVADDPMELDGPSAPVELPAQTPKVPAPKKKEFYVLNNSNAGSIIRLVDVKPDTDPVVFKSLFKTKMPPVDYFLISQEDGTTDGFIEFSRADDAINAALLETVKVFGKSVSIQRCIPPKEWSDFDEQEGAGNNNDIERKKIFVSNVDVQVDKPLLRSVFGQFGKLKEVRLVQRNTAAFAYLEYEIAKSAENSIQMNGRYLEGFPDRKLSVALADKTKTKKRVADPKELIITNFPPAMEKDEIIALFSK